MAKAALVLGVSDRQCYRIKARVTRKGARGVVHGNRGRASKRKVKEKTLKRIVELAKGKYRGFNDHHLTEKLMEYEGIELSREKVRRTLRACGILSPRKKRAPKHRSRRERRAAEGMMLQVDGSAHDWLEAYCAMYNLTQGRYVAPFVILTLQGLTLELKEGNNGRVHHGTTIQAGVFTIHL